MKNCYNIYNDSYDLIKDIENISSSQQTDITKEILSLTQTTGYVDNAYLQSAKIATIIVNPTPWIEKYIWIPEGSDNVVPGLDNSLTCAQSKHATLIALQHSITNITNIDTEIQNLSAEMNIIKIPNPQNVSKYLHYHTNHTDFTKEILKFIIIVVVV